jgi:hypothetical protein
MGGGSKMKQRVLRSLLIILFILLSFSGPVQATGKPDVTRHEAQALGGALNMQIEWQSPNPVVILRISIGNIQKEIKIDPYDNKRNRDGYAGEVNFTLNLEGTPSEPFPYVIQLEDELRIKSDLARGKVKVATAQQPRVIIQPQQPTMQIQIQQSITQPGVQPGITPGTQPGVFPGIQPGALPGIQPGILPGIQTGALPGLVPGMQPGSQQVGSLIVIIAPLIAAESGAMWRVENRPWKRNGEFIPDLPVGIHTIEFQDLSGWIKPESQKVMIESGQTHTINGFYNSR